MNFLQNLGTTEWAVIIFIFLVLFGKNKLIEWARGLGESGREIQKVKKEFEGAISPEDQFTAKSERVRRKKGA